MVQLDINSISVDFPYDPYPAQRVYMARVIDALRSGHNALLESPTGTGKTLCLLCAALAWRSTYVAALQAHTLPTNSAASSGTPATSQLLANAGLRPAKGVTSALAAIVQPDANRELACPRIIFSSRTHSQLSQAVAELKKTIYKPSMSIVASRDQLCLHDISTNFSGSRLNAMCRRITGPSRRQCRFHLPIASNRPHENRAIELVDKMHAQPPMDIEDLRAFGTAEGACPFFMSRAAARADACEILFLPYNYLLDQTARHSLDINWSNDIVIIDEAHNLESICADAMSFDLTPAMRSACDAELCKLIEKGLRPGGLAIPALEKMAGTEAGVDSVIGSENRDLLEIRLIRSILKSIDDFVNEAELDRGKDQDASFKVLPGSQLRKLMEEAGGPTLETYNLYIDMLDRVMDMEADTAQSNENSGAVEGGGVTSSGNSAIRVLQMAIRVLFESLLDGHEGCFRTVIQQTITRDSKARTLSYWCFKPSVAMKAINKLNLRCMLLTSGTLAPLDSFAAELGLSFPVRLENPHVVSKQQVFTGVVRSAPEVNGVKGGRLTSAYFARGETSSVDLGRSILRIASKVPDGLLVFYPSYAALYACVDVWKKCGPGVDRARPSIWECLQNFKRIVMEEREASGVSAAVLAHRANVESGYGSILLAVCRGKVSEGIDFSDEYGRAVAITGLPYPSAMDPKVILKREYADEEARRYYKEQGGRDNIEGKEKVLNGSQWYTVQAIRAVNQAVGRAIRHRYDYGAILLCDERFQSRPLQEKVSKWLRPSIVVHPAFSSFETSLAQFFQHATSSEFAKEGEKKRLAMRKRLQEKAQARERNEDDTMAVFAAQNAINMLQPPPKTEAQFVEKMVLLSDEIKAQKPVDGISPKGNKSQQDRETFSVLDLSSQGARGGLHDSGSERVTRNVDSTKRGAPMKRSVAFLASRAKRLESGATQGDDDGTSKRAKLSAPSLAVVPNGSQDKQREKLSAKIKQMFGKDSRKFLEGFRRILQAHAMVVEGEGPTQTVNALREEKENARKSVQHLVAMTYEATRSGAKGKETADSFLKELREKVPVPFRRWFDEAVDKI